MILLLGDAMRDGSPIYTGGKVMLIQGLHGSMQGTAFRHQHATTREG